MTLEAGEVEVIKEIPREMLEQIKKNNNLQVAASSPGGIYMVFAVRMNRKAPNDIVKDKKYGRLWLMLPAENHVGIF
ncbi:hypothetical protein JCM17380_52600 [Desulfosporosinus burensis]